MGRLAALMKTPDYADSQLVLIGFSAARGDYTSNRNLSRERAQAVRDRLVNAMGVKSAIAVGVGPAAPVACNTDGSPTASMNQRVEAWIRKNPGG
jgi:phosphate transport system substrate-binding protein